MIFLTTNLIIKRDWITIVFLLIFFLLSVVKFVYKERLFKLVSLFFSKEYFLNYGKDNRLIINNFNTILFIIQSLVLALLVFALISFYKPEIVENNTLVVFLKIGLFIVSFFALRYAISLLLGILFEVNKQQEYLTFAKLSYLFSSTLLILPLLFFVYYVKSYNLLAFQLTITVFTILLIIRYVVIFQNNKNNIYNKLFYFILYLCALEIAPFLLIYKMFASY